jgi:methylenetetrahydrofolate reductase (NADPH)
MNKFKEKLLDGKEFVVTCEFVPGRGSTGRSIEESIEFGKKAVASNLPVHAISITDNPGGNPAISPDVLGKELLGIGVAPLIHFASTDSNRNMIESRAYSLARDGIENLLVITGDCPVGGYEGMAKPIFDLGSVQMIQYLKDMNKGLQIPGRKKGTVDKLPATDFFVGCVVSPFKKFEAELMTQFFKLEKKVKAGADFIIPQLGYDMRKFAEIIKYMKYRNINVPILGNVYVVSRPVARLMNKGHIPGCVVTDSLLKKIEEEAAAPDKGKKARLERAAQMMSIFRGLRFNGVHIGGFGLKYEDFEFIIKRSEEIGDKWREYISNFQYGQEGEFYLFPDDPELTFAEEKLVPVAMPRKSGKSLHFLTSLIFHRCVFTEGAIGYKIAKLVYKMLEKLKFLGRFVYFLERQIKSLLFDCQECGDCALFDLAYLCPMSKCAKFQRNGPCGGSRHGMCESDDKKKCVWTLAYKRFSSAKKLDYFRTEYVPPVNCSLSKTSSWANLFLNRCHTGKKILANKQSR